VVPATKARGLTIWTKGSRAPRCEPGRNTHLAASVAPIPCPNSIVGVRVNKTRVDINSVRTPVVRGTVFSAID
jgi:hypothetical protein